MLGRMTMDPKVLKWNCEDEARRPCPGVGVAALCGVYNAAAEELA
jgi:hypothetical protein